jgi:hypothetical protein
MVDAAARESPPSRNATAPGTRCGERGERRTRGRDLAGVGDAELGESISVVDSQLTERMNCGGELSRRAVF